MLVVLKKFYKMCWKGTTWQAAFDPYRVKKGVAVKDFSELINHLRKNFVFGNTLRSAFECEYWDFWGFLGVEDSPGTWNFKFSGSSKCAINI